MLDHRYAAAASDPRHTGRDLATKALLVLLPLVAGLHWLGAAPSHASGESWSVTSIKTTGCNQFDWRLGVNRSGLDGGYYTFHAQVISDGKVYMNEGFTEASFNGDSDWVLYSTFSYEPADNPGTWPLTPGKPMKVVFSVERPVGTVLTSWTVVAASCDSATLLYNGPTAADVDEDYLATPADKCPALKSFRDNGCPLRDSSLALKARYGPKRVVGRLSAGHAALFAGRRVTVWKARPGPDRKVAVRTTDAAGRFKARVRNGRYYATAPGVLLPSAGQVTVARSAVVRVR